jgi:hypothetical protein
MADLNFQDMGISIKKFGEHDMTVDLRTLHLVLKPNDVAALLYPIFDAQEKALVASKSVAPSA